MSEEVVNRTFATFLSAEFGFFGVLVNTRRQIPNLCGEPCKAGVLWATSLLTRPATPFIV